MDELKRLRVFDERNGRPFDLENADTWGSHYVRPRIGWRKCENLTRVWRPKHENGYGPWDLTVTLLRARYHDGHQLYCNKGGRKMYPVDVRPDVPGVAAIALREYLRGPDGFSGDYTDEKTTADSYRDALIQTRARRFFLSDRTAEYCDDRGLDKCTAFILGDDDQQYCVEWVTDHLGRSIGWTYFRVHCGQ